MNTNLWNYFFYFSAPQLNTDEWHTVQHKVKKKGTKKDDEYKASFFP